MDKNEKRFRKIEIRINSLLTLVIAVFAFINVTIQNPNDFVTTISGSLLLLLLLIYIFRLLAQAEKI